MGFHFSFSGGYSLSLYACTYIYNTILSYYVHIYIYAYYVYIILYIYISYHIYIHIYIYTYIYIYIYILYIYIHIIYIYIYIYIYKLINTYMYIDIHMAKNQHHKHGMAPPHACPAAVAGRGFQGRYPTHRTCGFGE